MKKNNLLRNSGVQSMLASLMCILVGLLVGYIALLIINAEGAWEAICNIVKNFLYYPKPVQQLKYLGNTLVKTAPLLMCALSVLFANKAGLFNIGAAGQYVVGAGACLYMALALNLPWWACLLGAILAGALLGALSGFLKTKFNVNEVISCIMFNWISLYCVNMLLSKVKETTSPYTLGLKSNAPQALIPGMGLGEFFTRNQYVTIAVPLAILVSVSIWVLLERRLRQGKVEDALLPFLRQLAASAGGSESFLRSALALRVFDERGLLSMTLSGDRMNGIHPSGGGQFSQLALPPDIPKDPAFPVKTAHKAVLRRLSFPVGFPSPIDISAVVIPTDLIPAATAFVLINGIDHRLTRRTWRRLPSASDGWADRRGIGARRHRTGCRQRP